MRGTIEARILSFGADNLRFYNPFSLVWHCLAIETPLSLVKKEKAFLDGWLLPQDCPTHQAVPAPCGDRSAAAGRSGSRGGSANGCER